MEGRNSMKERMQGMKLSYNKEEKIQMDMNQSSDSNIFRSKKEFRILGQIGQGASATVEKCEHIESKKVVALKCIKLEGDEVFNRRLKLELETLMTCKCEYVVDCFSIFYESGCVFIALEYMNLGSLTHLLQKMGKLNEAIIGMITYQVMKGFVFLHKEKKIIHRDIKPSNLLINSEGCVKIADFGVSGKIEHTLDTSQSFVGTANYMSPERIEGNKYYSDTDLWSLGISLLECAMGEYPYKSAFEKITREGKLGFWDKFEIIAKQPIPAFPESLSPSFKDLLTILYLEIPYLRLGKSSGTRSSATELIHHPFLMKFEKATKDTFKNWLFNVFGKSEIF